MKSWPVFSFWAMNKSKESFPYVDKTKPYSVI